MKRFCVVLALLISSTSFAADFVPTPEQIKEAEHIRMAARKMGMDKADPEEVAEKMSQMKGLKREITEKEKKALACVFRKGQHIQFEAPIELFARYLNDKEFEEEMAAKHQKECGLKSQN